MSPVRILIMAGGTGGHVFPALAVAQELNTRGVEVSWLGTRRGLEAEVVPAAGFPIDFIRIGGLRGKGVMAWLGAPWRLLRAVGEAFAIVRRRRPAAVLGMGGFASGPGAVAAWLLRRPLLIHEQNAVPGLTNRLSARLAAAVLEAFPGTFPARVGAVVVGNPVRTAIAAAPEPPQRYADRDGPLRLLVVGGSLGAVALNRVVPEALKPLAAERRPLVRHQTGKRNLEAAREAYGQAGVAAQVVPFIDDMAAAYQWADLVLCRAGALTVSELAAAGCPALLVPYPHAVDDHQTLNGRFLAEAGAAELVQQAELSPERLTLLLQPYLDDAAGGRQRLQRMAVAARRAARPRAAADVADHLLIHAGTRREETP